MKSPKKAFAPMAPMMPAAAPMSTKTAPSVGTSVPTVSPPAPGAKMGGHNPDNLLPPQAFHGKGR